MQYQITIQDVDNLADELILHFSGKADISLRWLGGDDKTQSIIGSELTFSLLVDDCEEGKYDAYFTTNEKKWIVNLYQGSDESAKGLIWRGFLLPETYSEPYANKTFLVNFSAVDGLGLLKGEYLPDEYYKDELTVTDFITAALNITKMDFDLWFSRSISSTYVNSWNNIILDGLHFIDDDGKKMTAYEILEDIVYSMRCQLYQSDARWYLEGISKRQLISNEYVIYRMEDKGEPNSFQEKTKNVKQLDWVAYPDITLVPPFKEVVVSSDREDITFGDNIVSPELDVEIPTNSVQNYWIPERWEFSNDYYPLFYEDREGLLYKNKSQSNSLNTNRAFWLKYPPYLLKGQRVKIDISFKVFINDPNLPASDAQIASWSEKVPYKIFLGDEELFFNLGALNDQQEKLIFDSGYKSEATIIFTAKHNGALNVKVFEPIGNNEDNGFTEVAITNLELEEIDLNEDKNEDVYITSIEENASSVQEIDLPISQDITGLTPNWQLDYLRKYASGGTYIQGFVHRIFEDEGTTYYSVDIQTAKLIERYPKQTYYRITGATNYNFTVDEIIYNYEGSDEIVITGTKENTDDTPVQFNILASPTRDPQIKKDKWINWTNSFYEVEKKPYMQVVAELEKELYEVPFIKMEGDAKNPVKINDFVRFRYKNEWKYLMVTDCEWNIGNNTSSLILQEAMYNGSSIGKIPPYVFAGEDKMVQNAGIVVPNTDAYAISINGSIETYLWTQESGSTATIEQPDQLYPMIHNITGTGNVFKLTVTDSNGNTSSDTMEINTWGGESKVTLEDANGDSDVFFTVPEIPYNFKREFFLNFSPPLPDETLIRMDFVFEFGYRDGSVGFIDQDINFIKNEIRKNNFAVQFYDDGINGYDADEAYAEKRLFGSFYFRAGDNLSVWLDYAVFGLPTGSIYPLYNQLTVTGYEILEGTGEITNLPHCSLNARIPL